MQPGETFLAQFPFGDVAGLSDLVIDPSKREFRSTNLKTISILRLHKLATLHCASLARHLGVIDSATKTAVAAKLRSLLTL